MIQLISNRPLPPLLRGHRLTDPDLLLIIAERIRRDASHDRTSADDFGLVLGDLRMGGTWKRTNRGRLIQAQDAICDNLPSCPGAEISVLDLGASDGLTTLDLADALRTRFHVQVRVTLADLNLWLFRYRKGPVREYRAANGEPIMVKIGRLGLRLARPRHDQPQGTDSLSALYLCCKAFRGNMHFDTRISLVHPLIQSDPSISAMELDCLVRENSLTLRYDGVRASNILNKGYFTWSQIDSALGNIHSYLVDGGCFVVSRNRDADYGEPEDGSVWRKSGTRFLRVADFGKGSEISECVDCWQAV